MNVETMNLADDGDYMVPIENAVVPTPPPPPKVEEKNVDPIHSTQMDSTPIADILGSPDGMMMMPPQMAQPVVAPMGMGQRVALPPKKKYPLNLTEEQVEALLVGLVAVVATSKPLQERLVGFVPNYLNENGEKSLSGLLATALVAAILFYLSRRFFLKKDE
jgi:hypothetical protein